MRPKNILLPIILLLLVDPIISLSAQTQAQAEVSTCKAGLLGKQQFSLIFEKEIVDSNFSKRLRFRLHNKTTCDVRLFTYRNPTQVERTSQGGYKVVKLQESSPLPQDGDSHLIYRLVEAKLKQPPTRMVLPDYYLLYFLPAGKSTLVLIPEETYKKLTALKILIPYRLTNSYSQYDDYISLRIRKEKRGHLSHIPTGHPSSAR